MPEPFPDESKGVPCRKPSDPGVEPNAVEQKPEEKPEEESK